MRGQVILGTFGAVVTFLMSSDVIEALVDIVKIIMENWLVVCMLLWFLSSGLYYLLTPYGPLDSLGITLYTFYMFFVLPTPIPIKLWGLIIGADALTAAVLLMFNLLKLGFAFVFHGMLAFSLFHYAWSILKVAIDMLGFFR